MHQPMSLIEYISRAIIYSVIPSIACFAKNLETFSIECTF